MMRTTQPHDVHPAVVKKHYDTHSVWQFENNWHMKLFACKPFSRCCFACFCCCFMGCKVAKHLGEVQIVGCLPCSIPYHRTKLRTARRIDGFCCGDCCASIFCLACTTTQIANELESQGMWDPPKAKKTKQPRHERPNQYYDKN